MFSNLKNVVYIPSPNVQLQAGSLNDLSLEFVHIKNGIWRCHFCAYCSSLFLLKQVPIMLKDVILWVLFFSTSSESSTKVSLEILLSSLLLRAFLTAVKPSSWGMLGYKPTTFIVQSKKSLGRSFRPSNLRRKSLVSLTNDLTCFERVSRW